MKLTYSSWLFRGLAALLVGSSFAAVQAAPDVALLSRGEYLARAADCVVCHTAEGGKPYAGGLAFKTPFGVMFSSNITPDKETGIGRWTEQQFVDAVKHGVRADGQNLYPSMPYTSYSKMTDSDVKAIWAYLNSLPVVKHTVPANQMGFPFNQRWALAGWKLINVDNTPFTPSPEHDQVWNRGKYVATALAHCEECHTPRNISMGLTGKAYAGSMIDGWEAFNISSDPVAGIGSWTKADLVNYLHGGAVPGKASAGGAMADVVSHSLRYLTHDDMDALATYIKSVPAQSGTAGSRFNAGQPTDKLTTDVRGRTIGAEPSGAVLFSGNCASCHAVDGHGNGEKSYYPSLFHNSTVGADKPNNLIQVVLHGIHRTNAEGKEIVMPGFASELSDSEIATLTNYVVKNFGQPAVATVTPEVVKQLREGDADVIPSWVMVAAPVLAVVVLLALFVLFRRRKAR